MFRSSEKPLWQRFTRIFMGQVCVFSTTKIQLANLKAVTVNVENALKILRAAGENAFVIGHVADAQAGEHQVDLQGL